MSSSQCSPDESNDFGRQIAAARDGSRDALGQLFENCRDYLLLVANCELDPVLRAKGGASDLVQETFLKAQGGFRRFEGGTEAELLAWLRTILKNNLANFTREFRGTAKRQVACEIPLPADETVPDGGPQKVARTVETPSGMVMAKEQRTALERALALLPDDYRQVITLRHEQARSFAEIAQLMDRSPDAVRKLWSRAIERLAHAMESKR